MFMDEIWVAIIGLIIAVGIVGIIHWLLVGHVNIGSDTSKVILSLEVVAFVCLMATFVLGELFEIAERVLPGRKLLSRNPTLRVAHHIGQDGQKGDGMPKRSRLGWRTRLFRCLHFALSFVGIWLQSLVVTKPGITKIEKTRFSHDSSNVARTTGQVAAVAILVNAGNTHAQVAGSSTVGVTEEEMRSS
jgi:hypothetical protein